MARCRAPEPGCSTAAQEAIASGTVIAYAPEFFAMRSRSTPCAPEQTGQTLGGVRTGWSSYQKAIRFSPGPAPTRSQRARTGTSVTRTIPFLLARESCGGELIISRDEDIKAAGITVFDTLDILIDLRSYSRSRSVELQISVRRCCRWQGLGLRGRRAIAAVRARQVVHACADLREGNGDRLAVLPLLHGPTRAKNKELLVKA